MSQNSLVLATSGTLPGLAAVQAINAALDTLNTLAAGSSAPSSPEAGQLWHDTGNKVLKIRSMDNTSWITLGTLDETNYLFTAAKAAALTATLPISAGGTGATTAAAALTALLSGSVVPQANGGTGVTSMASLYSFYPGQNGYEISPSGRVTQWGLTGVIGGNGGSSNIGYPLAFPNGPLNVTATILGAGALQSNSVSVLNVASASQFTVTNNSSVNVQAYWHAEGH